MVQVPAPKYLLTSLPRFSGGSSKTEGSQCLWPCLAFGQPLLLSLPLTHSSLGRSQYTCVHTSSSSPLLSPLSVSPPSLDPLWGFWFLLYFAFFCFCFFYRFQRNYVESNKPSRTYIPSLLTMASMLRMSMFISANDFMAFKNSF